MSNKIYHVNLLQKRYDSFYTMKRSKDIRNYVSVQNGILLVTMDMLYASNGEAIIDLEHYKTLYGIKLNRMLQYADVCTLMELDKWSGVTSWKYARHTLKKFRWEWPTGFSRVSNLEEIIIKGSTK